MTLSLDTVVLGVPDLPAARTFYDAVFPPVTGDPRFALSPDAAEPTGFPGFVLTYVVEQPTEVTTVLAAADRHGAKVLKPGKKSLFAGFSAVCQAPGGAIWKLASPHRKDTGPAADPPVPTETAILLGVKDPQASKEFYTGLGLTVDRDYGSKYIDFVPAEGRCRLGLMQRPALAKDAGVDPDGTGTGGLVLSYRTDGETAGRFTDPDGFVWQATAS